MSVERSRGRYANAFLRRFIMESAEKPSLYDRLGGVYSIATVLDD
jgi:hypothetical protein